MVYTDSYCEPTRNETSVPWIEILVVFDCASDGDDLVSPLKSHECSIWALNTSTVAVCFNDHMRMKPVKFSGVYAVLAIM